MPASEGLAMAEMTCTGRATLPALHCFISHRPQARSRCLQHRHITLQGAKLQHRASLHQTRAEKEGTPLGSGELGRTPDDAYEFDEGAAQVQRLLQRDRKELMGAEEIGEGFRAEFDEDPNADAEDGGEDAAAEPSRTVASGEASSSGRPAGASANGGSPFAAGAGKTASPFGKAASGAASPFGSATSSKPQGKSRSPGGPGNPFNGAGGQSLFREMDARLSPTMQPDDFEEKPWWQNISLGQVVIVISFTLIISLMIGTFAVVVKLGGVRFNE